MSGQLVTSWEWARLGEGHRVVDLARDRFPGGLDVSVGHDSPRFEPLRIEAQRIPGYPGLELPIGTIAEMAVIEGATMLEPPIRLELHERRALPGPRVSDRLARELVHGLHVVPVAL